jgi:hypothetical protein
MNARGQHTHVLGVVDDEDLEDGGHLRRQHSVALVIEFLRVVLLEGKKKNTMTTTTTVKRLHRSSSIKGAAMGDRLWRALTTKEKRKWKMRSMLSSVKMEASVPSRAKISQLV